MKETWWTNKIDSYNLNDKIMTQQEKSKLIMLKMAINSEWIFIEIGESIPTIARK